MRLMGHYVICHQITSVDTLRTLFALIADRFGWEIKGYKVEQANSEQFLSQFSEYVYLRKTQSDNTLDHLIESHRILKKLFRKQRINYLKKLHREKILKYFQEIGAIVNGL